MAAKMTRPPLDPFHSRGKDVGESVEAFARSARGETIGRTVHLQDADVGGEEAILALQAREQALAGTLFDGEPGKRLAFDTDVIGELFAPRERGA